MVYSNLQHIFGSSFTRKPHFTHSKNEKWFFCKENKNFLHQHCSTFQYTQSCTIWGHLNKLCHECGHNTRHLAWKPRIFVHGSSVLRTLFQDNCPIQSLLFFLLTLGHLKWHTAEVFYFFDFFWISSADSKMRSKLRTWPFVARVGIWRKCY